MMRGRILLGALLLVAVAAAALGLAQMWFDFLGEKQLLDAFFTLAILGTVISFLVAVDYDLPGTRRKFSMYALTALVVIAAGLGIFQIWTAAIAVELFIKIMLSIVILIGLLSFSAAALEDLGANKKLRDEKFID